MDDVTIPAWKISTYPLNECSVSNSLCNGMSESFYIVVQKVVATTDVKFMFHFEVYRSCFVGFHRN